jgi:hypothetical protein
MARAASLAMAFCCRCNSAVPNPRAAPAALLAALSHMLIQGFFIEASFVSFGDGHWTGTSGCRSRSGALRHAAAGRDHAICVDRMNDAGPATKPSGNRAEDQRHEGQQGAGRHDRGGRVCGLGSDALRLIDCLMVLLFHLRDRLLRLLGRPGDPL